MRQPTEPDPARTGVGNGVRAPAPLPHACDSAKKRGNQSFKAGRFDDAEKHYTAAIDAGFEPGTAGLSSEDDARSIAPASVHFAAVCLCNRAAAAQGGGAFLYRRLSPTPPPTAHTAFYSYPFLFS